MLATGCALLIACNNEKKDDGKKTEEASTSATTTTETKKAATELLDLSAADGVKKSFAAFAKGDVAGMVADYDDKVRYEWSGGDTLVGKQAVQDYYSGRWKLIQSIKFSNEIVLPIMANESQVPGVVPTGKWVLYWVMADVTYKNGKNIKFWMHNANHYNEAGKIDQVGQYIDRHPIIEATK